MMLYLVWDKSTHLKKTQVSNPKSQEPRPTLKPRLELEIGIWNLRFNECGNLSRFKYKTERQILQFFAFNLKQCFHGRILLSSFN